MVELPPLRHRPREVPIVARLFLAEARARGGKAPVELSEARCRPLAAYAGGAPSAGGAQVAEGAPSSPPAAPPRCRRPRRRGSGRTPRS
ncbi:hypothetical protein [Sorangium sp. So ce1153]|uniref:hypothetical protein n=1 Tax=Sorangium sp. So ce1153 TaxID=3133333 RepID=UPI003F644EB0